MRSCRRIGTPAALVLCGLLLASGPAGAGKVYKWVDESGGVHYGEKPPPAVEAETIRVPAGSGSAVAEPPAPTEAERLAAQEAEYCRVATENYNSLGTAGEVKAMDEYGQVQVLTPEQKQTERERAKAAMERYCVAEPGTGATDAAAATP